MLKGLLRNGSHYKWGPGNFTVTSGGMIVQVPQLSWDTCFISVIWKQYMNNIIYFMDILWNLIYPHYGIYSTWTSMGHMEVS